MQEFNNDAAILKGTEGIIETIRFTDSTLTATELLKSFAPGSYTNTTSSVANATMSTGGDLAKLSNTATATTANTTYQTQNSQLAVINDAGGTADTVDFGANFVSTGASYRRLTNDDLVVTLANGAEITLQKHYAAGNANRIENLKFADATIDAATLDSLVATIAPATAGNDTQRCDNVSHFWGAKSRLAFDPEGISEAGMKVAANDEEWRVAA